MFNHLMVHYIGGACGDLLKSCIWLGISGYTIYKRTGDRIDFSPDGNLRISDTGRLMTLDIPSNIYGDAIKSARHDIEYYLSQSPILSDVTGTLEQIYTEHREKCYVRERDYPSVLNGHDVIDNFLLRPVYAEQVYDTLCSVFNIDTNVVITQNSIKSTRIQYNMARRKNRFPELESLDEYHSRINTAINRTVDIVDNPKTIELEDMLVYDKLIQFLNSEFNILDTDNKIKTLLSIWKKKQLKNDLD